MPGTTTADNDQPFVIDDATGNILSFVISTDGTDVSISVGTVGIETINVFTASDIADSDPALTAWLNRLPSAFYTFIGIYNDPTLDFYPDYDET